MAHTPDSWWLKFKRAQQHMREIDRCLRQYSRRHPYRLVAMPQKSTNPTLRRYVLEMDSPHPMIQIALGDFIHNLRSALDHMVVACSEGKHRKSSSFQILYEDIFERDGNGNFVHPDKSRREGFRSALAGLKNRPQPLAMIMAAQPFQSPDPHGHIFGILSRLENADKHRQMIVVAAGLRGATITVTSRGVTQITHSIPRHQYFYANQQVLEFSVGNPSLADSDIEAVARGTANVNVQVSGVPGNASEAEFAIRTVMLKALRDVRLFLRVMEPFAIR